MARHTHKRKYHSMTDLRAIKCDHCGQYGRNKGAASKNHITRYFCHDNERSCYKERAGRYFDDIS